MNRPSPPRLLLIADRTAIPALEGPLLAALRGGVGHVLLREKEAEGGALLHRARAMAQPCSAHGAQLLVHGRTDVALALPGAGVHLPEREVPTAMARRLLGSGRLLGRSCHSVEGARRALGEGADYVTLSPVFPTRSHPDATPLGVETLRRMCREIPGPVLALGGITPDNAGAVMDAGAFGVALIRGLLDAPDPQQAARRLLDRVHPGA